MSSVAPTHTSARPWPTPHALVSRVANSSRSPCARTCFVSAFMRPFGPYQITLTAVPGGASFTVIPSVTGSPARNVFASYANCVVEARRTPGAKRTSSTHDCAATGDTSAAAVVDGAIAELAELVRIFGPLVEEAKKQKPPRRKKADVAALPVGPDDEPRDDEQEARIEAAVPAPADGGPATERAEDSADGPGDPPPAVQRIETALKTCVNDAAADASNHTAIATTPSTSTCATSARSTRRSRAGRKA